jgi:hypothetical protein
MKKLKSKPKIISTEFFIDFANHKRLPNWLLPPKKKAKKGYWNKFLYDKTKIPEVRNFLVKILNQIIADGKLKDSDEIQYFIDVNRAMIVTFEVVDGKLERIVSYPKAEDTELKELATPIWLKELADDLLGYLTNPDNDLRKIKKCKWCKCYFIASRIDKRILYCAECSSKSRMSKETRRRYQRDYRRKKRIEKMTKERESRIDTIMKSGFSREDAIEIIEADSKL